MDSRKRRAESLRDPRPRSPFHKSFSAVVGPNGSGKSNVIDAMLFVFGKRAQQLRLRKVSELIHHSAAAPNCTYAKVAVHFTEILGEPRVPWTAGVAGPGTCFVGSPRPCARMPHTCLVPTTYLRPSPVLPRLRPRRR